MGNNDLSGLAIQRAAERIRQETETFEQRRKHADRWFTLQLVMGFSSIFLLTAVIVVCSVILLNSKSYSESVVFTAGAALFTDVLGLLVTVWKIVLNPNPLTQLQPVTDVDPSIAVEEESEEKKQE